MNKTKINKEVPNKGQGRLFTYTKQDWTFGASFFL